MRILIGNIILFICVGILISSLLYVTKIADKYIKVATQVYCEQRADFDKCSQEFKEKTSKLMKER